MDLCESRYMYGPLRIKMHFYSCAPLKKEKFTCSFKRIEWTFRNLNINIRAGVSVKIADEEQEEKFHIFRSYLRLDLSEALGSACFATAIVFRLTQNMDQWSEESLMDYSAFQAERKGTRILHFISHPLDRITENIFSVFISLSLKLSSIPTRKDVAKEHRSGTGLTVNIFGLNLQSFHCVLV